MNLYPHGGLLQTDNLICATSYSAPLFLAAGSVSAPYDLSQRVTSTDTVDEAKRIAYVALAAGVRTDDDRERPNGQTLVREVLEIDEP